MATEVGGKTLQADSLRRHEQYRAADSSLTIVVLGYKFRFLLAIVYQKLARKWRFYIGVSG
jgi:hypothetical protein